MKNRINLIALLALIVLNSCASHEKKGNYVFDDTHQGIEIELTHDNQIKIKENNGGVFSSCSGTFKNLSKNKIVYDCNDMRGDSINRGSIINIIPPEFNIDNETIKIRKNKLIYKGKVLKKI